MGAVQKIVSIGMDKALTLSRPKINAPAKSPSSRPAFISPAAIRSSVKTGVCRPSAPAWTLAAAKWCGGFPVPFDRSFEVLPQFV